LEADAKIEIVFFSVSVDIDTATLHYVPCCRYRGSRESREVIEKSREAVRQFNDDDTTTTLLLNRKQGENRKQRVYMRNRVSGEVFQRVILHA